jgi:hypothetical protein
MARLVLAAGEQGRDLERSPASLASAVEDDAVARVRRAQPLEPPVEAARARMMSRSIFGDVRAVAGAIARRACI